MDQRIPDGVDMAAGWSWRFLVIAAAVAVAGFALAQLPLVVVPVLIAVLLTALLLPLQQRLRRARAPRWLATLGTVLALLLALGILVGIVVLDVRAGVPDLQHRLTDSIRGTLEGAASGPLALGSDVVTAATNAAATFLRQQAGEVVSAVASIGAQAVRLAAGGLLTLFTLIFLLFDGRRVWQWCTGLLPNRGRSAIRIAGEASWASLSNYVRAQIVVASIDAVGIGLGAVLLGLPLSVAIAVLVFVASFVPVVGAVATGIIAVGVALLFKGWVAALIMLVIVLVVQQIEGHVLLPLILGSAVQIHPLAAVLAVAIGGSVAGIAGTFFAVPLVAVVNKAVQSLRSRPDRGAPDGRRNGARVRSLRTSSTLYASRRTRHVQ